MSLRPTWPGSLLSLVLIALFVALGNWQRERAQTKDERIASFHSAGQSQALPEPSQARPDLRVQLVGRFDNRRHTLADNQVYMGRAGLHVYTPFETAGRTLLVNRGWLAMTGDRAKLPQVPTDQDMLEIHGRLAEVPGVGRRLGEALEMQQDQWPQLVTYPDVGRISAALDQELYPLVLLLDADSPGGFEGRNWQPVYLSPEKHRAYAFQWYALALAVIAGWVLLSFKRGEVLKERES